MNTSKLTSFFENDVLSIPELIASQDLAEIMHANSPYISPTPRESLCNLIASISALINACHNLQYVTRKSSESVCKKKNILPTSVNYDKISYRHQF